MATEIKAIETVYNGYRFRSRLEARWAVFFDASCVPYEYEPEGYVLSNGDPYLPDFYLPNIDAYVEIKHSNYFEFGMDGHDMTFDAKDKKTNLKYANAINDLVDDDHIFILLCSDPYECIQNSLGLQDTNGKGVIFHKDTCLYKEMIRTKMIKASEVIHPDGSKCKGMKCHPNLFSCNEFLGFSKDGKVLVVINPNDRRIPLPYNSFSFVKSKHEDVNYSKELEDIAKNILLKDAKRARQARFEHGECG